MEMRKVAPCPRCPDPEEWEPGSVYQSGTYSSASKSGHPDNWCGEEIEWDTRWTPCDMCEAGDWSVAERKLFEETAEVYEVEAETQERGDY